MPLYNYKCEKCGFEKTEVREVEKRNDEKTCREETIIETNDKEWGTPKEPIRLFCNGGMRLKIGRTSFQFKER